MPAHDAWILGGGALGSALAAHLSQQGRNVTVLSPTPRPHRGLWSSFRWPGSLPALPPDTDVWVALAPRAGEEEAFWQHLPGLLGVLAHRKPASLTVCAPDGHPSLAAAPGAAWLTLPPLAHPQAGIVGGWVEALRAGRAVELPKEAPATRLLVAEDAARVAVALAGQPGRYALAGPELLAPRALLDALTRHLGGRWRHPWRAPPGWAAAAARLARGVSVEPPEWPAAWGEREDVMHWIQRLPAPAGRR